VPRQEPTASVFASAIGFIEVFFERYSEATRTAAQKRRADADDRTNIRGNEHKRQFLSLRQHEVQINANDYHKNRFFAAVGAKTAVVASHQKASGLYIVAVVLNCLLHDLLARPTRRACPMSMASE